MTDEPTNPSMQTSWFPSATIDSALHKVLSSPHMSDQEIRARAMECLCRLFVGKGPNILVSDHQSFAAFFSLGEEIANYIKDGTRPPMELP